MGKKQNFWHSYLQWVKIAHKLSKVEKNTKIGNLC